MGEYKDEMEFVEDQVQRPKIPRPQHQSSLRVQHQSYAACQDIGTRDHDLTDSDDGSISVYGDPCMCDVSFVEEAPVKAVRILEKLVLMAVAKGGDYSAPMGADRIIRAVWQRCNKLTPEVARQALGGIAKMAAHRFEAVDTVITNQLVRISRLILKWTCQYDTLEEQGKSLQLACDRVMSLEAELDFHRHKQTATRDEMPCLTLSHLMDEAASERRQHAMAVQQLRKCLGDVEARLDIAQAELSKTTKNSNSIEAELSKSMKHSSKIQQQNDKLTEELVQLECFKSSRTGAIVEELERELAETKVALAQVEADKDDLEFEVSNLKGLSPDRGSVISLAGYSNASSPPQYDVSPIA